MASLFKELDPKLSEYRDRRFEGTDEEYYIRLRRSRTVYIGNLSFETSEFQIYELFSKAGEIRQLVMGLDKLQRTPCGFCFVVYYARADAEAAVNNISGMWLDGRQIRVDIDWGFVEGRQFGRGRSGGQVRDEVRRQQQQQQGYQEQLMRSIDVREAHAVDPYLMHQQQPDAQVYGLRPWHAQPPAPPSQHEGGHRHSRHRDGHNSKRPRTQGQYSGRRGRHDHQSADNHQSHRPARMRDEEDV